ncbi:hypothetical protein N656DRAFT_343007 [Canariomyces notabilis]|uniref:Uncharacterized protein n=1 Tax=Canariomyces notabilis TaxID=2074819 RepID=A0AAN6QIN0_9PEZI|nr:hypothetical protein N656DRAFT_343007 [Canariomyces arenarius]
MSRCYINRISSIFRRRRGRSQLARHMAVPPGLFRPHPSSTAQADISYWRMVRLDSDMTREEGRLAAGNFAWVATQHLEWAKPPSSTRPASPGIHGFHFQPTEPNDDSLTCRITARSASGHHCRNWPIPICIALESATSVHICRLSTHFLASEAQHLAIRILMFCRFVTAVCLNRSFEITDTLVCNH